MPPIIAAIAIAPIAIGTARLGAVVDAERDAGLRTDRAAGARHAKRANRPRDVLEHLLAHVLEPQVELAGDLVVDRRRDQDAARLREALEPRRDVDPVAQQVVALDDDLAKVDADAEEHPLRLGQRFVARLQRVLDLDRAAHRVDNAAELGEYRVTRRADDAAVVERDDPIDDGAVRREYAQRVLFVLADKSAVADRVGREDAGEAALEAVRVHGLGSASMLVCKLTRLAAAAGTHYPVRADVRYTQGRWEVDRANDR